MMTYSVNTIADYFLSRISAEDNDVSNLKLQKLCYYAQGLVTAMRGQALFSEEIYAWDHGPVVPELYHRFKSHGSLPIPVIKEFDSESIESSDRKALDDILEYYGQYSAWALRNMTHDEKPWIDAYKEGNKQISVTELAEFFKPQIDENYTRSVYGKIQ